MLLRKIPLMWIVTTITVMVIAFLIVPHASGQGYTGVGKATPTPTLDPAGSESSGDYVPPTACISGGPTSGLAPLSVNFDSSCSGGNIVYYFWDMGNGATSENPTASTTYHNPGTYSVSLTVCSPTFECDSTSRTVTVNTPPPPAPTACISGGPTSGLVPLSVNFDSSCSGGNIVHYFWDMGNGATGENPTASTTYHNPGTYTVSLTVCSPNTQCDSTSRTVTVISPPSPSSTVLPPTAPTACFNANPTSGNAPLHVNFSNCSSGNIVNYSWNFGDGGTSQSPNPSHTFVETGIHNVTLMVCDMANLCDIAIGMVTIWE